MVDSEGFIRPAIGDITSQCNGYSIFYVGNRCNVEVTFINPYIAVKKSGPTGNEVQGYPQHAGAGATAGAHHAIGFVAAAGHAEAVNAFAPHARGELLAFGGAPHAVAFGALAPHAGAFVAGAQ